MIATICLQDWNLWPTITAAPPFNLSRATELVIPAQSHDVPARNSVEFKAGPKETPLLDDSPLMEGWQIALTAGRGRLIIFPEAQVVADGHTLGLVTKIDPALLEGPQKRTLKMDDSYRISSFTLSESNRSYALPKTPAAG